LVQETPLLNYKNPFSNFVHVFDPNEGRGKVRGTFGFFVKPILSDSCPL